MITFAIFAGIFIIAIALVLHNFNLTWKQLDRIEKKIDDLAKRRP